MNAPRQRPASRRTDRRGFTLVELMVASVIAIIVILAIFSLFQAMSNIFFSQNQLVDTQSNTRFALELISEEMSRAGHLGSPSATEDRLLCPQPSVTGLTAPQLVPIRVVDNAGSGQVFAGGSTAAAANSNIQPDDLWLIGAFEVPQAIPVERFTGQTVAVDPVAIGTLLNITVPVNGSNASIARFEAAFTPGRMLRISGPDGSMQISTITGVNGSANPPTITVNQITYSGVESDDGSGTISCGVSGVSGEGYEVSVLNIYEYSVQQDAFNQAKMDLVRQEMSAATGNPLTDTNGNALGPVPILEYVVDFQAWVDCNLGTTTLPFIPADTTLGDDQGNNDQVNCADSSGLASENQAARTAHISITARTAREDKTTEHIPRANDANELAPILSFNADNNATSSAQVVTIGTAVELHNLTLRNLTLPGNGI